jgi:predicted nucleotidyltransferase
MAIPLELADYVDTVLAIVGDGAESLWLFGSRANNKARPDSDWDLILFSNVEGLEKLKQANSLNCVNIDLLVAIDEDNWISPWPDGEAEPKQGSTTQFDWKITGPGRASYLGRPLYRNPEEWWKENKVHRDQLCAYQIWP